MWRIKGTGVLADKLIYYKDEDLECRANDVLVTINIKIDNEVATSYKKVLDFIINLLNKGFPCCYTIEFSSKFKKHISQMILSQISAGGTARKEYRIIYGSFSGLNISVGESDAKIAKDNKMIFNVLFLFGVETNQIPIPT